jgi:ATP-dependent DNA helicase RecG
LIVVEGSLVRRLSLDTPVQFVRGVGPVRAEAFAALGVETVEDLLNHLPARYEHLPESVPIDRLILGEPATVIGAVESVRKRGGRSRGSVVARVLDGTGVCLVRWFNAPYVADRIQPGDIIRVCGKVDCHRDTAQIVNPVYQIVGDVAGAERIDVACFEPVYPATGRISSAAIGKIIIKIVDEVAEEVAEFVPESIRERRRLPSRRTAIVRVHRPTSLDDAVVARRRLAYDELFLMQMGIQLIRAKRADRSLAPVISVSARVDDRIRGRLPFSLTPGQNHAVEEITSDLAGTRAMNRLLQGDVGSGKTAVAIYAALAAIANRLQVAMIAPTEVLASQHHSKVCRYLHESRVRIGYLVGNLGKREREQVSARAAAGEIDLLVGTHAVIQGGVEFSNLGLVIIDEQHRFGVAQRAALRSKGRDPHCLVMTATPIPRTLAMTFLGDLDVTSIRDAPPGRKPVVTRLVRGEDVERVWSFLRKRLDSGEQAFVVYPLVEESEHTDLASATAEYETLASGVLAGYRVGLMHGRMKADERRLAMDRFREGDTQVLVATTVVEVGVDVANATVMVIRHAERFGLSQLHQLRGRVGRGEREATCFLVADSCNETSFRRLDVIRKTNDGFEVAEADLRHRGPGELLGTRQHGMPPLKAADLVQDIDLLEWARDDAVGVVKRDASLRKAEHADLRNELRRRYGGTVEFMSVG